MPQVSDVTEERTGGRGEELEQDDEVHSLLTYESSPSARGELRQINTTVERTEPLPTNPTEILTVAQHSSTTATIKHPHNTNQMLSSPRQLGRGRRRLYRRIRKAVVNFFTHELPNLRSPESIRALPWRARVNLYLSNPEESQLGWRLQQLLMLVIFVNIGTMASETVDGPRFGSSDPGYPYMPGGSVFNALEALFTFLFVIEFAFRWLSTPSQKQFWSSIRTWITFLGAIAALPRLGLLAIGAETSRVETFVYNFRILRAIRLILLAHAYVGTKVLFRAVIAAIPPLTITLFFLITVVMVFATAIFYAEPCYDLQTCTFTDILNTGYFVMLTVATVGYGSQVPSLHNPGSLFLVCIVMIFGTVYFSMPLAIVGIKYELAWTEYDTFAQNTKRLQLDRSLREKKPSSKLLTETSRRHILHAIVRPDEDEILEKIDSLTIKYASSVTCDRFYQLSQAIIQVTFSLEYITAPQENVKDSLMTLEAVIQSTKRRSDEASQALDGVMSLIKLHSRVCAEAHELLSALRTPSPDQETDLDRFISSSKLGSKDTHGFGSHRVSTMSRAKGAIAAFGSKAVKAITHHDYHNSSNTLRAKIWNTFEHRHVTQISRAVNKMRMFVVVLSIGVFYLQTTPELQKTGLKTFLCQRNVHDFCTAYDEPGCYVFRRVAGSGTTISVEVTEQPLDLHCSIGDPDEACYASGVNFGSDNFPLSCSEVFPSSSGIEHVCKNRLCNPSVQLLFDMEPYWIYVEFFFGLWFTGELALRVYSHPVRRHLWGDMKLHGHVIFLIPFYVELVEIMIGEWPTYSVVPAMPSFFTAVRFMKSLRILKLGSHIPGSRVLIRTAQLITDRLAIPLFFLFLGCVVSAAVFFELERGTECFVGRRCMWWHKNVLTPELEEGLPTGKRILVQNTLLTIITDMLRSTWFSLVSFTTVGYGDLYPRTSLGKMLDIIGMIFSSCYTAMPLTLVGGQFYVCYEIHAQEKRLRRERVQQRIKPDDTTSRAMAESMLQAFASSRDAVPNCEVVLPRLQRADARTESKAALDLVETINQIPTASQRTMSVSSLLSTVRDEDPAPTQQYTHSTEVQIISNFFLMQKVFHETIKDISLLNCLGIERVNTMRKNSSEAATKIPDVREREELIEAKISENMEFCVTACLNFAAMIERTLGTQHTRKRRQRPSIIQTNALLAAAELTSELLQPDLSVSTKSSKSNRTNKSIAAPSDPTPDLSESPSFTPTTSLQPKSTSLKRIATISKIFVGPILQSQRTQRAAKLAEFTNKKDQRHSSLTL